MKKHRILFAFISLISFTISSQVTIGFQGGEPGNSWAFTSTGADAMALNQSTLTPNIVTGNASLVVGGNTPGGSCIDGGSGNGNDVLRQFTFSSLNISTSSNFVRTLTFNWGTRFPICVGTGWDGGEDLIFTAYHDGVAQPPVTLAVGNNNANFNIKTNQATWSVPACVNAFYFTVGVITNRRDELLFIDDVKLTTPAMNTPVAAASPIVTANTTVCTGSQQNMSVNAAANTVFTWSGLPAGASFTTPNGTATSNSITINWGTAPAGVYTITVTPSKDVCGVQTAGQPSTITITVVAASVTAAGTTTICAGQSTQISASGATSYSWNNGLGAGSTFQVSPAATTTYTVTGTTGGCTATASVTVTVTPATPVVATGTTTICAGQTTQISASGATSYTWDNGLGAGSTFTVSPAVTTTYTVTGNTNGCTSTASVTVSVLTANAVTATGAATICAGQSTQISASGATIYTWNNGLGAGSAFQVSPLVTTTYTVTGSNANGNCSATASVTITVTPLPAVIATATPAIICPGASAVLNASGANTYNWAPAPGLNTLTGPSVTVNPQASTTYSVTGTQNGCSRTVSVNVQVAPVPNVSAGNDITICEGSPVTLNGSGADTYSWNNGVTNGVAFIPVASGTYHVTGTTNAGCTGTDEVVVTIETVPTPGFMPTITTGCLPLQVAFINITPLITGAQWNWNFGDGTTSSASNPLHTFYASGCRDISLELTSPNGCKTSRTMDDLICIDPGPVASFHVNPLELDESNPVASMVNTSENAVSYVWDFGDGSVLNTEVSPEHTYGVSQDGSYTVMLIAYNEEGCTDTTWVKLPFSEAPIYYVPNAFTPDGNEFNQTFHPVFTAGYDPAHFNLKVYNRWGEHLFESNDPGIGWDGTGTDGRIVPDGTYTWKIEFTLKHTDDRRLLKGHVTLLR